MPGATGEAIEKQETVMAAKLHLKAISVIFSGDTLNKTADVEMSPQFMAHMKFTRVNIS